MAPTRSDPDDDIDLSVLDDDPDDQVIRRTRTTIPAARSGAVLDPDADFQRFLSENRERNEEKARIEAMLDRSRQAQQTTQSELERIRNEIAREKAEATRILAFDLDPDSEAAWTGTRTPPRRPTLKVAELAQLLLPTPDSSAKLCDLLVQPIESNALCRRVWGQRDAARDLVRFLWHLAAAHPDPFVAQRAAMLLLATASDADREPSTLVTLGRTDLPVGLDRGRHLHGVEPARFVEAFLSNGARNVLESEPVPSMAFPLTGVL